MEWELSVVAHAPAWRGRELTARSRAQLAHVRTDKVSSRNAQGMETRRNTARNGRKCEQDTRRAKFMVPSWAFPAEGETIAQFRYRQT